MTDDQSIKQDDQQGGSTTQGKSSLIKVDHAKSNDQYIADAESYYIIPKLVRESFPDLIKLIFETESMDEEEREYWLQILPIMTEDQIKKFREILINEKMQLEKLDQEYEQEMSKLEQKHTSVLDEEAIKKQRETLRVEESKNEDTEAREEENLLKELDDI